MPLNIEDVKTLQSTLARLAGLSDSEIMERAATHDTWSALFSDMTGDRRAVWELSKEFHLPNGLTLEDHLFCLDWCGDHPAEAGFVTDAFGLRTRTKYASKWAPLDGTVAPWTFAGCFEHDVIEWFALLKTISETQDCFTIAELGAGWGPWITAASVFARRSGFEHIHAIAVEADETRFGFINQHLEDNGVGDVKLTKYCGAMAPTDGEVLFPKLPDSTFDMGIAAIFEEQDPANIDLDYRGVRREHRRHPAFSMNHILADLDAVDFMHVDIQGAELDVLRAGFDEVCAKCRNLLIATHTRHVEWAIAELLMARGWVLEKEQACQMHNGEMWANSGRTWPLVKKDGTQFWRNPQLA